MHLIQYGWDLFSTFQEDHVDKPTICVELDKYLVHVPNMIIWLGDKRVSQSSPIICCFVRKTMEDVQIEMSWSAENGCLQQTKRIYEENYKQHDCI